MRKFLAVSMAALTLGTTIAATAVTPAAARSGYYDRYGRWHSGSNNDAAYAIAGGIVGLALGAALSSSSNRNRYYSGGRYYDDYGYGDSYYNGYNGGYYDNYGSYGRNYYGGYYDNYSRPYRTCTSRRTVWDPYIGAYITKRFRYAC